MSNTNVRPLTPQHQARVLKEVADITGGAGITPLDIYRTDDPAFVRAAIQDALGTLALLEDGRISQAQAIATIRRDLRPCVPLRVIRAELKP